MTVVHSILHKPMPEAAGPNVHHVNHGLHVGFFMSGTADLKLGIDPSSNGVWSCKWVHDAPVWVVLEGTNARLNVVVSLRGSRIGGIRASWPVCSMLSCRPMWPSKGLRFFIKSSSSCSCQPVSTRSAHQLPAWHLAAGECRCCLALGQMTLNTNRRYYLSSRGRCHLCVSGGSHMYHANVLREVKEGAKPSCVCCYVTLFLHSSLAADTSHTHS